MFASKKPHQVRCKFKGDEDMISIQKYKNLFFRLYLGNPLNMALSLLRMAKIGIFSFRPICCFYSENMDKYSMDK